MTIELKPQIITGTKTVRATGALSMGRNRPPGVLATINPIAGTRVKLVMLRYAYFRTQTNISIRIAGENVLTDGTLVGADVTSQKVGLMSLGNKTFVIGGGGPSDIGPIEGGVDENMEIVFSASEGETRNDYIYYAYQLLA